jgi:hypothetical protein
MVVELLVKRVFPGVTRRHDDRDADLQRHAKCDRGNDGFGSSCPLISTGPKRRTQTSGDAKKKKITKPDWISKKTFKPH